MNVTTITPSKKPTYYGEENAFTLELVVSCPEHEASLSFLLEASFECYPDRDYCVISIPHHLPCFPLLYNFNRVIPRQSSNFSQMLYTAHRSTIKARITVSSATRSDLTDVITMTSRLYKPESLNQQILSSLKSSDSIYSTYVFRCNGQLIGLAVVREEYDFDYLNTHFQLTDLINVSLYKPGSFGHLEYFTLSPIFKQHSTYLLSEVHRLSDFSILFYTLTPADSTSTLRTRPLAVILGKSFFLSIYKYYLSVS